MAIKIYGQWFGGGTRVSFWIHDETGAELFFDHGDANYRSVVWEAVTVAYTRLTGLPAPAEPHEWLRAG